MSECDGERCDVGEAAGSIETAVEVSGLAIRVLPAHSGVGSGPLWFQHVAPEFAPHWE